MKKYYFLVLCFLTFGMLSAQEKLSKEEQARREKNIQAGNPFAKFGYKAKVATLSKGKYLEVHDLDSIVTIGSIRYHVDRKQIVGNIVIDTTDMYARPIGDTPSRWLSPDPLSEEFPDWSPYTMSFNNPMRFVDPDGMAPTDIVILGKNNSSLTIKTNLIDVKINAGAIVGDLGGNYSFSGNDFVVTALDIVGVVDPTPASDLLSASLSADGGDWLGAGASVLGAVLPYAGDLAKGPKIAKGLDKISDAIDSVKKIGPAGDAGATVTKQVPSDWTMKTSKNGQGTVFKDPKNPAGNNVRVQSGNPNSPNAAQQKPYVKQTSNGKTVDAKGKQVPSNSAESHIPKKDFKFNKN
ncbi:hypothetical protein [Flavobacterium sp.]|jgi:hypothetical protein|uniref:hypothetical protein n=1 Tax=Flavobacterium sp. TaxID=239 RepID=UPI0037C06DC8